MDLSDPDLARLETAARLMQLRVVDNLELCMTQFFFANVWAARWKIEVNCELLRRKYRAKAAAHVGSYAWETLSWFIHQVRTEPVSWDNMKREVYIALTSPDAGFVKECFSEEKAEEFIYEYECA